MADPLVIEELKKEVAELLKKSPRYLRDRKGRELLEKAVGKGLNWEEMAEIFERKADALEKIFSEHQSSKIKREGSQKPEAVILKRLQKGPWSIPEIARHFETSEEEAVRLVDSLYRRRGYDIQHDRSTKKVSLSSDTIKLEALHLDPSQNKQREGIMRYVRKVGVVHGTVLGSKYSNPTLLHTIYAEFEREGVDFVIHLGDAVTGNLVRKRKEESFLYDAEEQVKYFLDNYPKPKSFKTYIISGARDLSFQSSKDPEINVIRGICEDESRQDLIYRGDYYATFQVRGVRIEALNPGEDYAPYSKSYPLQNILTNVISEEESLAPKESDEAVIALVGGSHVYDRIKYGGIHGVLVPSLQSLTPYQKNKRRRGFAPTIGACVIELKFNEDWKLDRSKGDGVKIWALKVKKYQKPNDYKAVVEIKADLLELHKNILKFLNEQSRTEGEISRAFKIHKDKVWEVIGELQKNGYEIHTPEDKKATRKFQLQGKHAESFHSLPIKTLFCEKHIAAFTSDQHLGSFDQQLSLLKRFYVLCDERGVEKFFSCGDTTAGDFDHPANRQKVFIPGLEGQIKFAVDHFPKSAKGVKTVMIAGDHDNQHGGRKGLDVMRALFAPHRPDAEYLGALYGLSQLGNINIELMHPKGGAGYSLSYRPQAIAESEIRRSRVTGAKLHVLALGHYHIYNELIHSELIVISVPCFQQQTRDYMLPKGLDPWIGGLICEFVADKDGYITKFATEFVDMAHLAKTPDFPDMPLDEFLKKYICIPDVSD